MKIAFKTFGCRANNVDTDMLYFQARRRGFDIVNESEVADAYVINSCTVTSNADRDARTQARRFKKLNPKAMVGVIGCYAQMAPKELSDQATIDFVVGTANKDRILDLFKNSQQNQQQPFEVQPATGYLPEEFPGSRNARASVKIQDGCNYSCSFCIIPQARGRSRSLPLEVVLNQIDKAYAQGFNEVVLTGIHIAHYGWDQNTDLTELLYKAFEKPSGPRIRLSTLDPFELPDEIISLVGKEKRLCPHFHIAIQSGSDQVLSQMRRLYKAAEFTEVTQKLREQDPNTFVGVDIIVGFPGEDEKEFIKTVDCLKESYWTKLHVFPFSLRKGTRAETIEPKIDASEISKRSKALRLLSEERYRSFLNAQLGTEKNVLLERPSKKHQGFWLGHTENYIPTLSKAQGHTAREVIRLKLDRVDGEKIWAN